MPNANVFKSILAGRPARLASSTSSTNEMVHLARMAQRCGARMEMIINTVLPAEDLCAIARAGGNRVSFAFR